MFNGMQRRHPVGEDGILGSAPLPVKPTRCIRCPAVNPAALYGWQVPPQGWDRRFPITVSVSPYVFIVPPVCSH
jgi:hypothetical protein